MDDRIPAISVTPSRLVYYTYYNGQGYHEHSTTNWQQNFSFNSTFGILSKSAQKKIRLAIDWLIFMSPKKRVYLKSTGKRYTFKINFITLTLPSTQFHSDSYIKSKMLDHFLQKLRRSHKMKFYLWKAETQKNGNLHFHITTNVFIEYWILRKYWNDILNTHGYIQHYSRNQQKYFADGFRMSQNPKDKRSFYSQYKSYVWNKLINWQDPNSTDVHSVRSIRNLSGYLVKYFTKQNYWCDGCRSYAEPLFRDVDYQEVKINDDTTFNYAVFNCAKCNHEVRARMVDGRLWYMSDALRKFQKAITDAGSQFDKEFEIIFNSFKNHSHTYDHASVIYVNYEKWKNLNVPGLKKLFNQYFSDLIFRQEFTI